MAGERGNESPTPNFGFPIARLDRSARLRTDAADLEITAIEIAHEHGMLLEHMERPVLDPISERNHAPHPDALPLRGGDLVSIRSPVTSRSNWAKDRSRLRVNRPMPVIVLNAWVTETNDT